MRRLARAVLAAAAVSAGLAALTAWSRREVRRGEAAYPADGRFVELASGGRLHVVERGSGPELVLIHGADGVGRMLTATIADELARDHRVLVVDRPGHGWSTLPAGAAPDVTLNASLIAEALGRLGVRRPLLVGHSYGGLTALAMAEADPDAYRALVLLAPVGAFPWRGPVWLLKAAAVPVLGRVLTDALVVPLGRVVIGPLEWNAFHPSAVPERYRLTARALYLRPSQFRALASEYAHLRADVERLVPRLPELRLPVEIVAGTGDRVTRLDSHSRGLAAVLPDARLTVVEGAGHEFMWTHPDEIVAAVRRVEERVRRPL